MSGLAWHGEKENIQGRKYDVFIEGIGYQYRRGVYSYTAMALNDSNGNPMASATVGLSVPVWKIRLGLDAGLGSRVVFEDGIAVRMLVPILLPKLEVPIERFMVNLSYIPRIDTDTVHINRTIYLNIGLKI